MTRSALKMAVVSLVALLAACSDAPQGPSQADIDKAIDDKVAALPPKPAAAHVASFAVAPVSIKKGESATLTWSVENATAVVIKDSDGKAIAGVDPAALSGTVTVSPTATTTYLLEASGEGGKDFAIGRVSVPTDTVTIPPAPLLFAAVPTEIEAGQAAYLVWNSPENVLVTDDANAELSATTKVGSLAVKPLKDTTYTAKTNTTPAQTVTATVKVNAAILAFASDKTGAAPGDTVQFHWTTAGANEVKLNERSRGLVYTAKNAAEANDFTFTDTIPAGLPDGTVLLYSLTAKNANGTRTANLSLTVSTKPTITELKGPTVLTKGGTKKPTLSWKTTNGKALEIYSGAKGTTPNSLEFRALSTAISTGSVELPLPAADTDYLLVVTSDLGAQATKTLSLKLVAPPAIATFTVNGQATANVDNGGDSVNLAWTTSGGAVVTVSESAGGTVYSTTSPSQMASGTTTARPGAQTEYVLTVTNEAGDTVTKKVTVTVTSPLKITFNPDPALDGADVGMSWDFSSITGIQGVVGAPVGQTYPQGGVATADFIELNADPLAKEIATISNTTSTGKMENLPFPDGFKFRHFGQVYDNAGVCENGFIQFDTTATSCSSKPSSTIPSTSSPNNWIGPWAMDTLKDGKVLYRVFGTAPTRTLVIQWENFDRSSATPRAKISFELVLYETGQVDFLYKDMQGTGCTGTSCSLVMGMENQDGSIGFKSTYNVAPGGAGTGTQGDIVTFNGLQPPTTTTPVTVKASGGSIYELNLLVGTGSIAVRGTPRVIKANDVAITEVMYKPLASATKGQWVELQNRSTFDLDLSKFTLTTSADPTGTALSGTLPAGAVKVVGQSSVAAENGDTPVDIVLGTLSLGATADTLAVKLGTGSVTTLSYNDASMTVAAGASVAAGSDPRFRTASGPAMCISSTIYGTAGSKGSPGSLASGCTLPFSVSTVPADFRNVYSTGTKLVTGDYWNLKKVTFPAGFTFPYFGANKTEVMMGSGYLNFDTTQSNSTSNTYKDNPTSFPSGSATPSGGTVAAFWDADGYTSLSANAYVYEFFVNPDGNAATADGYAVFQWNAMDFNGQSPDGDMNYEVILFENGDIEFQYDKMTAGGYGADRAKGNSASIGLMNLDNSAAFVLGHNEAIVSPYSGFKFIKQ